MRRLTSILLIGLAAPFAAANAQDATTPAPAANAVAAPTSKAPDSLVLYFASGSAAVRTEDVALLDQASRLYRDGHPIIMVVSGSADAVGQPAANLALSERRAQAVVQGLIARGIPAERFQVLAKGETDPAVQTPPGVGDLHNRRVEISWR